MKSTPINFSSRRQKALNELGNSAMLVMSQPEATRNSDVGHHYRQESFLYYLTGFEEPETALLLIGGKKGGDRAVLFLRERDDFMELWNGKRLGTKAAPSTLGVDKAFIIEKLWEELPELIKGVDKLYYHFGLSDEWDAKVVGALKAEKKKRGRTSENSYVPVFDADVISGALRLRKDAAEIARMRRAAEITKKGFDVVFKNLRPGMNERDVQGMLVGEYLKNGSEMEAYGAIVAGGVNACCLHYHENKCTLNDGELLLIDSGSQFEYYASDVTRTFPVGKRYSAEQKALYEIVLNAQLKCIDSAVVGKTLVEIHDIAIRVMMEGLKDIGLVKGSVEECIKSLDFKKFYPHGTSHWLGMDVHDVGSYSLNGKPLPLEPGMVFTIEPGLYIDTKNTDVPEKFRGIGIRIEDDIHITTSGPEVITKDIPKSVEEMENRY